MAVNGDSPQSDRFDRVDEFRAYAERRAEGGVAVPPLQLLPHERRLHVRQTLIEDNQARIENRPHGAQTKFDALASDLFSFFRGTALLYYRDHAGSDAHLPIVLTVGDVHPENFGVMPNSDGAPFFGVNDFDEAWAAPFSYDIKRGATGFWIVAAQHGDRKKDRRRIVHAFVRGYLDAMHAYAHDDRSSTFQFRHDNSPPMIRSLLQGAMTSRAGFLAKLVDPATTRFRPSKKRVPNSSRVPEFQDVVDRYVKANEMDGLLRRESFFRVLDVARKKGSGTASLGLDRFWVLIEGRSPEPDGCVVLEMKQTRRSALHGLVPADDVDPGGDHPASARRVVAAHQVHLVGGDPLYGFAEIDGRSFLVRERSPFKDEIDLDDLDTDDLAEYAGICGQALAQPHARSAAEAGIMAGDGERRVLSSIVPELFCSDVVEFAQVAADRVHDDHAIFRRDHACGAFRNRNRNRD